MQHYWFIPILLVLSTENCAYGAIAPIGLAGIQQISFNFYWLKYHVLWIENDLIYFYAQIHRKYIDATRTSTLCLRFKKRWNDRFNQNIW